jgi:hypothetical protein
VFHERCTERFEATGLELEAGGHPMAAEARQVRRAGGEAAMQVVGRDAPAGRW